MAFEWILGISGSQEAAEQRGCRCYQVNVLRVVGGSTDVENFKLAVEGSAGAKKRNEEAKREENGRKRTRGKRERERAVGEKTMEHGGAWLSGSDGGDKYGV